MIELLVRLTVIGGSILGIISAIRVLGVPTTIVVVVAVIIASLVWWLSSFRLCALGARTLYVLDEHGTEVRYKKDAHYLVTASNVSSIPVTLYSDGALQNVSVAFDGATLDIAPGGPRGQTLLNTGRTLRPLTKHFLELSATHVNAFSRTQEWVQLDVDFPSLAKNSVTVVFPTQRPPKVWRCEKRFGGRFSDCNRVKHHVDPNTGAVHLILDTPFFPFPGYQYSVIWMW